MLAPMSGKTEATRPARSAPHFGDAIRSEFPLFIGLGTAAIFLGTGARLVEAVGHPLLLALVFLWLFAVILWSAICVVRHADCLAIKFGEPYGTLILTLSAISIEVAMISTSMLHGENNPTLGRDAIFAVVMIALNGLVGVCLLMGGLRHREQRYNLQGVNSYLNVIMTLAVLGLVMPNFTTSTSGPTLSGLQGLFLAATSVGLYGIFVIIQTMRHSQYFVESTNIAVAPQKSPDHDREIGSTGYHAVMLLLYLVTVVVLAEKFGVPLDESMELFGMPPALGGAIIAALVLTPAIAPAHTRGERRHIYEWEDEHPPGLHSPAAVRSVFTTDIFALSFLHYPRWPECGERKIEAPETHSLVRWHPRLSQE